MDTFFLIFGLENLFGFILIFVEGLIFVCAYANSTENDNDNDIKNASKWPLIFAVLCWFCCLLSDMIPVFEMNGCNILFECNKNTMEFLSGIFFIVGTIIMYVYLLHHLYYGFKNTQYSISLVRVIVFILLLAVYGIAFMLLQIIHYLYDGSKVDNNSFIILLCISCGAEFILSSLLLLVFVYKLCKMGNNISEDFNQQKQEASNRQSLVDLKQNFEDNIEDMSLDATKIFTLSIFILLSVEIDGILSILVIVTQSPFLGKATFMYSPLVRIVLPWLMMLSFDFMNSYYNCCCLNVCCNCIKECCTLTLRKKAKLSASNDFNDDLINR